MQDYNIFSKISVIEDAVPEYYSHGSKNTDIRAFQYRAGKLDPAFGGLVPYRLTTPAFKADSCVVEMAVQIAIANYCNASENRGDRADIWMGNLTEKFNDANVVSTGFWPAFTVVRDLENNPLPEACEEGGYNIIVTPSASSIDSFLPVKGYWPANVKNKGNGLSQQAGGVSN